MTTLTVRPIDQQTHLAYIATRPSVSFLQTPAWGRVKAGWQSTSLGWYDGSRLVGAGLLLLRRVPRLRRCLAYLPEGPDLDWTEHGDAGLAALADFARTQGAFQVKIGPAVWRRRWDSESIKAAITTGSAADLAHLAATQHNPAGEQLIARLESAGWRRDARGSGFGDFQPRFVFQLDLRGRTEAELLAGFNQLWRRNIRKSQQAGVTVRLGTAEDLPAFHRCYTETAARDGFTPRSLAYFQKMWHEMRAEAPERITLHLAEHPDHAGVIAATTMTRVGDHAWYSYGASTTAARELRPSNAVQWSMMRSALADGAAVYDMRGISDTLHSDDHLFGLLQFKLGTGGYAQEYVGEWDLVLSPLWARAYSWYMARR